MTGRSVRARATRTCSRAVPEDSWHFHDSRCAQDCISHDAQPRRASKSASRTRNRHVAAARCPASSQICASSRSSGTTGGPSGDAATSDGGRAEAKMELGLSVSNMYSRLARGSDKNRRGGSWETTRVTALKLPSLPFALEPAGNPPPGCRVRSGVLTLTAAARTDMFVDPAGAGEVPEAGRCVGFPPAGDFTLATQVSADFASMYDAGVLLLHAAERTWAKLCFESSPQLKPTAVTVVTRETSDDCNSFEVDGSTLWLWI